MNSLSWPVSLAAVSPLLRSGSRRGLSRVQHSAQAASAPHRNAEGVDDGPKLETGARPTGNWR